jgi:hypothetical protein
MNPQQAPMVYAQQPQQDDEDDQRQYAPFMRAETRADVMKEIRPEETVEILFHKLMGERYVNGRWEKLKHMERLALTEVGAWDIASLLLGISNKNTSYSNLTEKEIKWRVLRIADAAQEMMLSNWQDYGIKTTNQLRFVNEIIMSIALVTLKQAESAGMRNAVMRTQTEIHSTMQQQAMPSQSFISKMLNWRNR